MRSVVVFDLDGCISDDRHRLPLLPDYEAYHERCREDAPMNLDVVMCYSEASFHDVVFVTARPESARDCTRSWLRGTFGHDNFALLMRPAGNTDPSPTLKVKLLRGFCAPENVVVAYDDREDVLGAYVACGVKKVARLTYPQQHHTPPSEALRLMADTYDERNAVYKDNYKRVAPIMAQLFPDGAPPELLHDHSFHLLELAVVKLTRFAISGMTHTDSIHDAGVYCAMIESITKTKQ